MNIDTIDIINKSVDLVIKNDTLIVKTIFDNPTKQNGVPEIVKLIVPIIGTLISVFLGFLISKWNEKTKNNKENRNLFKSELINFYNGKDNYLQMLNLYSKLTNKEKKKFNEVENIKTLKPDEKQLTLEKLIKL